ncbi:MAG: hypothetical protein IJG63_07050 [Oscillospiraceae bacterium]|nr:hypothetical protein [Oscillospiraceae bacterium]
MKDCKCCILRIIAALAIIGAAVAAIIIFRDKIEEFFSGLMEKYCPVCGFEDDEFELEDDFEEFEDIKDEVKDSAEKAVDAVKDAAEDVSEKVSDAVESAVDAVADAIE